jgi:hypothetical protein
VCVCVCVCVCVLCVCCVLCAVCQAIFWFVFCHTRQFRGADSKFSTYAAGISAGYVRGSGSALLCLSPV